VEDRERGHGVRCSDVAELKLIPRFMRVTG
jgi:hypothetical protein